MNYGVLQKFVAILKVKYKKTNYEKSIVVFTNGIKARFGVLLRFH